MDYHTIRYETLDQGEIARITYTRGISSAGYGNAEEMADALQRITDDNKVRVLILGSEGPSFGVLGDITKPQHPPGHGYFPIPGMKPQPVDRMCKDILRKLYVPVIAAVHGWAISMLLEECDLIVAADDTKMGIIPPRNGDGPEHDIASWMLDMPKRKAKELLFTCQPFDAAELYRIGWVNKVVPRDRLDEEALAMAKLIANVNPLIIRLTKEMYNTMEELLGYRTIDKSLEWYHALGDYMCTPFGRPEMDQKRWKMGMKWFNAASRLGAFRDIETRDKVIEESMKELERQNGTFTDFVKMEKIIKDTITAVRIAPDWKGPAIR